MIIKIKGFQEPSLLDLISKIDFLYTEAFLRIS